MEIPVSSLWTTEICGSVTASGLAWLFWCCWYVVVTFSSGSSAHLPDRRSAGIQTEGTVTVVTVGNPPNTHGLNNHLTGSLTSASLSSSTTLTQYRNASTSTREINFPGSSLALAAQHLAPGYVIQQPYTTPSAITLASATGVTTINTISGTIPYNTVPAITSSRNSIRYRHNKCYLWKRTAWFSFKICTRIS